jgi:2-dehydropantoate 2-reductase
MNDLQPLNVLVFGAGAVGTYIGGSLALRGHRVTFIEQPQAAAEVQARGLRLDLSTAQLLPNVPISGDPSFTLSPSSFHCVTSLGDALALHPYDVSIVALKSFDTQAAIEGMLPYKENMPPVLCLQNGVENETMLAAALDSERVIPGTLTSAIGRRAVGDINLERLRGLGVAAGHPLSERLVDTLGEAGLKARLYPSAAAMKWSKLLTNLLANPTSAILDMTPAEIFAHPGLHRLEIEQLRETLRVMAKQGTSVVDLPGTPVRLLALATRLPLSLSRPLMLRSIGRGRGNKMPSFHIDLHSGRGRSEVEYLHGAVVRYGDKLGIHTPVNRRLTEILLGLTKGQMPIDAYRRKPDKLVKEIEIKR